MHMGNLRLRSIRHPLWFALLFLVISLLPSIALGQETPTVTITQDFIYDEGGDVPAIPQSYTDESGAAYHLVEQRTAFVESSTPTSESVERSHSLIVESTSQDEAVASLPATLRISQDGLSGDIPLVSWSAQPLFETITQQVDRTTIIEDLPTNDVQQIPETAVFTVSSATSPDGTTLSTLSLAGISFETTGVDVSGIPDTYRATALYRGTEDALVVGGYEVTGEYVGDIYATDRQRVITAIYTLDTPPVDQGAESADAIATAEENVDLIPFYLTRSFRISLVLALGLISALIACAVAFRVKKKSLTSKGEATHV